MNMDRALKERIIGATVLVLFVVLVVPVFLDGPENDNAVISQTVPLPGQSGEANQTIVLHRDREHPVPVATSGKLPEEDKPTPERPEPAVAEPQQTAAVTEEPETPQPVQQPAAEEPPGDNIQAPPEPAASATGMWAVQLGSFGNQENADKLAADLRKQNYTAFLSKLSTGDGDLHRVRIGPQKDRESAEQVAAQLAKAGHKGQVVPHP
jgi:DedD protein